MRLLYGMLIVAFLANGCAGCDDLGDPTNRDCGNNIREANEVCDGVDLAGASCASLGYASGTLDCAVGCAGYVVAGCDGTGDRVRDICSGCTEQERCTDERCEPVCTAEPWTDDVEVAFDVEVIDVPITLAYSDDPTEWAGDDLQGRFEFTATLPWQPARVEVPIGGTSVDATLYAGDYSVRWFRADEAQPAVTFADVEISEGSALDFELPAFHAVSGSVSFSGRPLPQVLGELPESARGRGSLIFSNRDPWQPFVGPTAVVPIAADGTYEAFLAAGDYRVLWSRREPYPAASYIGYVSVDAGETTHDLDVLADIVELVVDLPASIEGSPADVLPSLRLEHTVERYDIAVPGYSFWSSTLVSLDEDLTGRALVPRGLTRVIGQLDAEQQFGSAPLTLFDISADDDNVVEVPVELFEVSGTILRNGERVPNNDFSGSRGLVHFSDGFLGSVTVPITESGPATFRAFLPEGTWEVRVAGNYWSGVLPLVPATVEESLRVGTAGRTELTYDVPAVEFAGVVTANGERLPDEESENRGTLQIRREGGSVWHAVPVPPRGPAGYELVLSPGTYSFGLTRWWFGVPGESAPQSFLPLGEWLAGTVEVDGAMRRDIDVRLYRVEVGLAGDALPPGGTLWFHDRGSRRAARVVELAPETWNAEVTLYPGHYRVSYHHDDIGALVLENSLVIDANQSLSFERALITLRASVTRNGAPTGEATGRLILDRVPEASDTTLWLPLDARGVAETKLPAGHYGVYFDAEDAVGWPSYIVSLDRPCEDLGVFPSDIVDEDAAD